MFYPPVQLFGRFSSALNSGYNANVNGIVASSSYLKVIPQDGIVTGTVQCPRQKLLSRGFQTGIAAYNSINSTAMLLTTSSFGTDQTLGSPLSNFPPGHQSPHYHWHCHQQQLLHCLHWMSVRSWNDFFEEHIFSWTDRVGQTAQYVTISFALLVCSY